MGSPSRDPTTGRTPRRAERRRRALSLLLIVLLSGPLLAGCIHRKDGGLFGDRTIFREKGTFSATVQAELDGLGLEWKHLWVTFAYFRLFAGGGYTDPVELFVSNHTVDLVSVGENQSRFEIARAKLPGAVYQGYAFYINKVEGERMKRVASRGTDAFALERVSIDPNVVPVELPAAVVVYSAAKTEISLVLHLARSLFIDSDGRLNHHTAIQYEQAYVQGRKVAEITLMNIPRERQGDPLEGTIRPDGSSNSPTGRRDPVARMVVRDDLGHELYSSSYPGLDDRVPWALHPDETVAFLGGRSEDLDPGGAVKFWDWDFHDGSGWNGRDASHAFGSGGVYDVILAVEDDNLGFDQMRLAVYVDYRLAEAASNVTRGAAGLLLAGTGRLAEDNRGIGSTNHTFTFAETGEDGLTRLGGYTVRLTTPTPLAILDLRVATTNDTDYRYGHRRVNETTNHTAEGPIELTLRGGPYTWGDLRVDVIGRQGAAIEYDLEVTAHYFPDVYTGYDGHPNHFHEPWHEWIDASRFGPDGSLLPAGERP